MIIGFFAIKNIAKNNVIKDNADKRVLWVLFIPCLILLTFIFLDVWEPLFSKTFYNRGGGALFARAIFYLFLIFVHNIYLFLLSRKLRELPLGDWIKFIFYAFVIVVFLPAIYYDFNYYLQTIISNHL
jgi:magnesium-transporting ATPase (P-type)